MNFPVSFTCVVIILTLNSVSVNAADARLDVHLDLNDTPFSYRCDFSDGHVTKLASTEAGEVHEINAISKARLLIGNEHHLFAVLEKVCKQMQVVEESHHAPWCTVSIELSAAGSTRHWELTGHHEFLRVVLLEMKVIRKIHALLLKDGHYSKHSAWAFMDVKRCTGYSTRYPVDLPVEGNASLESD